MINFEKIFEKLFKSKPYPWQKELYQELLKGNMPDILDIPTGLGKTSIMAIWLLAYAEAYESNKSVKIPTRLVYMVDRRTIVDQASDEAEKIQSWLKENKDTSDTFKMLAEQFNIVKLRGGGGSADDREWLKHPNHPSIIIGTIDMIGSRLLFSGYGIGRKIRPFYAGLLCQDVLIILDETHLSPAMESLLSNIKEITTNVKEKLFPPKILLMSATQRDENVTKKLTLTSSDKNDENVKKRYKAIKNLKLVKSKNNIVDDVVEQAKKMQGRILIYLQKPKDVKEASKKIETKLKIKKENIVILTGTLRGFERDKLVENNTYQLFLNAPTNKIQDEPIFLISTSAGEVGSNFDADNMICDLSTLDSIIQRLGRVNRSGGRKADVVVIYSDKTIKSTKTTEFKKALENTLNYLKEVTKIKEYNASPENLSKLMKNKDVNTMFSPMPETQPLTLDILEMWAMTSIYEKYTSRPHIRYWLHGKPEEYVRPETYVAWREDVEYLCKLKNEQIENVLDTHRLLPHEMLREHTYEVKIVLDKLDKNSNIIILTSDGRCNVKKIRNIEENDIQFATILLPNHIGGLDSNGFLSEISLNPVADVADDERYFNRHRLLVENIEDGETTSKHITKKFGNKKSTHDSAETENNPTHQKLDEWLKDEKAIRLTNEFTLNTDNDEDDLSKEIHYYVKKDRSAISTDAEKLDEHLKNTRQEADKITKELDLPSNIIESVILAAEFHDIGKKREHWQRCMQVDEKDRPLAKTYKRIRPLPMGGFRHEFASLVDSISNKIITKHKEKDLIMHLISSHHGWSRPNFMQNAGKGEDEHLTDVQLIEAMQRYGHLQKRFGPWGLAYLEGLVRGSDWSASS